MRDVNKKAVDSVYSTVQKGLEGKSVRILRESIRRLEENYSYRILDNFNIDKVDEYVKSREGTGRISIASVRKLNKISDMELEDSLYPIIRKGVSHTGDRRSRRATKEQKGLIPTELIEINLTSLVPDIIYFLANESFNREEYYSKFTHKELKDFQNLCISLMSRTLIQSEGDKLGTYFKKDKVTDRFYRNIKEASPISTKEYKHPNPMSIELFKNSTIVIETIYDIIYSYIKSILLPITIIILERMNRHNSLNNKYKMMVRSISNYKIIVERDMKCAFSPTYSSGNGVVFRPKLVVLKTLHRTKQEALEEIEELSSDDFQDMINSQFGGIRAVEEVEKTWVEGDDYEEEYKEYEEDYGGDYEEEYGEDEEED